MADGVMLGVDKGDEVAQPVGEDQGPDEPAAERHGAKAEPDGQGVGHLQQDVQRLRAREHVACMGYAENGGGDAQRRRLATSRPGPQHQPAKHHFLYETRERGENGEGQQRVAARDVDAEREIAHREQESRDIQPHRPGTLGFPKSDFPPPAHLNTISTKRTAITSSE